MEATDILMSEHRVIERVLAALETAVQRLEQGQEVRPGFFLDAADFIKGFKKAALKMKLGFRQSR
jgi:hemerythrin-like domain-containing protein